MFILQNRSTAGKHITILWYIIQKVCWFSIKHIRRSQLYSFFYFLSFNLTPLQIFQSNFLGMDFFSVHSVSIILFHEVIDLPKQLFVVKPLTFLNNDPSYSQAKDRFYYRLCHRIRHCYL